MKQIKINFTLFFLVFLFTGLLTQAQTPDANGIVYVKPTATGNATGTDWNNATADLHNAINSGATKVLVATGTYKVGAHSFIMKNGVEIYGGFNPVGNTTDWNTRTLPGSANIQGSVLDGENARPVIWNVFDAGTVMNNTAVLDGFTIINGSYGSDGGGMRNIYASPTLVNLSIKNNTAGYGAGIANNNSSPVITNVSITNNKATSPEGSAGIYNEFNSSPILTNVTIAYNNATDKYAPVGGIRNSGYTCLPYLYNCIIWGNTINGDANKQGADMAGLVGGVKNTLTQVFSTGNSQDNNLVGVDPLFISTTDFSLQSGSPAIDKGSNQWYWDAVGGGAPLPPQGEAGWGLDLAGNARVFNFATTGTIDMGAYESPYEPLAPDANGIIYVKETAGGTGSGKDWNNATSSLHYAITSGASKVYVATGTYPVGSASFIMKNGVELYGGFNPVGNTTDWDTRTLPGPANGQGSVLDGQNAKTVFYNNNNGLDNSAVLDGFTITHGSFTTGAGMYNNNVSPTLSNLWIKDNTASSDGGGVYNLSSSPMMTNVTLSNNKASYAGGIMNRTSSSPVMTAVTISNNTATNDGGGMYNDASSSPVMNKVSITANQATNGAGMYNRNQSSPIITNGLIADNVATGNGGAIRNESTSSPLLTNVTIANNSGTNTLYATGGTTTLANAIVYGTVSGAYTAQNSLIEGNAGGTNGNLDGTTITLAQVFTSPSTKDYTLKSGSPAINAGNNTLFTDLDADTKDLGGNKRLEGLNIDLGTYEHIGTLPVSLINFTAKADGDHALLQWKTASESNNRGFEVYRAGEVEGRGMEGATFIKIGEVGSQIPSALQPSAFYSFTDKAPLAGNNYYKLVQIDNDGKATDLGVRTVNFGLLFSELRLYPNPTDDIVTVSFASGAFSQLQVADLRGRILQQINLNATESSKQISLGVYPAGTYMIKLHGNGKTESRKVVKTY